MLADLVDHVTSAYGTSLADLSSAAVATSDALVALLGSGSAVLSALASSLEAQGFSPAASREVVESALRDIQASDRLSAGHSLRRRLRCPVVLVLAVDDHIAELQTPEQLLLGWDKATLGRVTLAACPGTHHSIISDHCSVLAWHVFCAVFGFERSISSWSQAGDSLWRYAKTGRGFSAPQETLSAAADAAKRASQLALAAGAHLSSSHGGGAIPASGVSDMDLLLVPVDSASSSRPRKSSISVLDPTDSAGRQAPRARASQSRASFSNRPRASIDSNDPRWRESFHLFPSSGPSTASRPRWSADAALG